MNKPKLIVLTGYARSGKDTIMIDIKTEWNLFNYSRGRFFQYAFSDVPKEVCYNLVKDFNITSKDNNPYVTIKDIFYSDYKDNSYIDFNTFEIFYNYSESEIQENGRTILSLERCAELAYQRESYKNGEVISVRNFILTYSDNIIKPAFGRNFFLNIIKGRIMKNIKNSHIEGEDIVIGITDLRYEHEADFIRSDFFKDFDIYVVRVHRKGIEPNSIRERNVHDLIDKDIKESNIEFIDFYNDYPLNDRKYNEQIRNIVNKLQ